MISITDCENCGNILTIIHYSNLEEGDSCNHCGKVDEVFHLFCSDDCLIDWLEARK